MSVNMKKSILFSAFYLITLVANSQQISTDMVQAPNASDLGKYGDIDVSCYTGQLDLTIPICEYNVFNCKLPINIRYDSSGVLVNKLPGWTGSNWTLQAGGAIVRTKYGTWDEVVPVNQGTLTTFQNYFSNPSRLLDDMNNDDVLKDNLYFGRCDYSPDVFTFNFMGKTGKFFFGNDGQWKVYSDNNIDVVFDVNDNENYIYPFIDHYPYSYMRKVPKGIKGFTLRDDNGFIYEFGGTTDAIDYTVPFFRQMEQESTECFFPTCWYLTSVKDKYGNEIYKFEYERGKFIAQFYLDEEMIRVEQYDKFDGLHYGTDFVANNSLFPYGGSLNSPVYLKSITSNGTTLAVFHSEDTDIPTKNYYPNLDVNNYYMGAVYDGLPFYYLQTDDKDIRKYQYTQQGVSSISNPLNATRLRMLKSIDLYNINVTFDYGTEKNRFLRHMTFQPGEKEENSYTFNYYFPENLPADCLTKKTDDWGYYNSGTTAKDESNPFGIDLYGSRYGALTDVVYPTGGKSCFEYDVNDYGGCMSDDRSKLEVKSGKTGGLRIRKITEYDNDGTKLLRQREFIYNDPATGRSSGELFAAPKHEWTNWYANTADKSSYSKQSYYRNQSIIPLSNSFGPHVGYSYAKETEMDGSYKVYRFQNISSAYDEKFLKDFSNGNPSPFDMYTERGYKRGKSLSIEQYSFDGNILSRHAYGYEQNELESDYVLTSNLKRGNYGDFASFGFYSGGIYKLLFPKYDVVADTLFQYTGSQAVIDVTHYAKKNNTIDINYKYAHKSLARILINETHRRGDFQNEIHFDYPFSSADETTRNVSLKMFDMNPNRFAEYRNGHLYGGTEYTFANDWIGPVVDGIYRINTDGSKSIIEKHSDFSKCGQPGTIIKNGMANISVAWDKWIGMPNKQTIKYSEDPDGKVITNTVERDMWGNIITIIYPNEHTIDYRRDALGRIMEETVDSYAKKRNEYNYKK